MDNETAAIDITNLVFRNLLDRSGFDHWYYEIDKATIRDMKDDISAEIQSYLNAKNVDR